MTDDSLQSIFRVRESRALMLTPSSVLTVVRNSAAVANIASEYQHDNDCDLVFFVQA
jgi:hypothetical protein